MTKEFQVTCITKPNRLSPHEHITHIGNREVGWCLTRDEAIRRIDGALVNGEQEKFYTVDGITGRKIYLGVVRGDGNKTPYLRTQADGKWNDNLLALYECGDACPIVA